MNEGMNEKAVGGRPPRYAPAPLLPPLAPKRLTPNTFPRPPM